MTLDEYLLIRFNRNNHPKYRKYAVEWISNLTTEQLLYFRKEMLKLQERFKELGYVNQ